MCTGIHYNWPLGGGNGEGMEICCRGKRSNKFTWGICVIGLENLCTPVSFN